MSLSTFDSGSLDKAMAMRTEHHPQRLLLSTLALVAFTFTTATSILTVLDTVSLFSANASFRVLSTVAAVLNVLATAALVVFVSQLIWRRGGPLASTKGRMGLQLCCLALAVIASILTLITYVLTQTNIRVIEGAGRRADLTAASFTLWTISTLAQLAFYILALRTRPASADRQCSGAAGESIGQKMREPTPPMTLDILPKVPVPVSSPPSPTFSNASTQSLASLRSSLHQVVRPITSRTKLLGRKSLSLRDSASFYSGYSTRTNSLSHPDGFESWDTSSVDQQAREAIMQSAAPTRDTTLRPLASMRGTPLDPIPGSRPVSPAHALDGPFPRTPSSEDDLAAPLPAFISSPHTSRPSTPDNIDSANIHPLFRSDSPVPPPAVTPGTVVIASPFSGQVIPRPPTSRSRANSRTRQANPSPLIPFDSTSVRSGKSAHSVRSPSPPGRGMTPPIPDSILGDSAGVSSAESLRNRA